eukprot:CAMPEP_0114257512 /NCGR_PEP_ID=MMETSP0058-20121206/18776_1 /TAXON_ID=36894 /ORGANISM="Pyramimonas parkeae, CCMP726" /LENGTH=49 /DNA_ID= /DNA_START= /DNA_END= /DNA_ORIENTATION=
MPLSIASATSDGRALGSTSARRATGSMVSRCAVSLSKAAHSAVSPSPLT